MVFSEVLEEAASKIDGCIGLVVMELDGIAIDKLVPEQPPDAPMFPDFDMLATVCTTVLRSTTQAAAEVQAGALQELIVMTEGVTVLSVSITAEHVLFGAVRSGTNYGKARFYLKRAATALSAEFV